MTFLGKLSLGKKISLLLVLGLVLGISVFSFLGMRAVNQATEVMLEDRLTTAHLVAGYLDETLERALTELGSAARSIGGDGSPAAIAASVEQQQSATGEIARGSPTEVILETAARVSADIIVLGTHGRVGMDAFWTGSIAPRVARRADFPLLLVPVSDRQ